MAEPARIFISHSCKDLAPDPDPEVERRLEYARGVRDAIASGLRAKGFEVLLDRALLEPGQAWRAKLHTWLGTCHGAVILLSEDSIASDWVKKEATILTWRKEMGSPLKLIPVLLGGLDPAELAKTGFGPLEVLVSQAAQLEPPLATALTEAGASTLASKVVDSFEGLERFRDQTRFSKWVRAVAAKLRAVSDEELDSARKVLGIEDDAWALEGHPLTVAHHLLQMEEDREHEERPDALLTRAYQVLHDLRVELGSEDDVKAVVERIKPIWVDRVAALEVLSAANFPATGDAAAGVKRPVLAINASMERTGRAYVNRALCCDILSLRIMPFSDRCLAGEGQEDEVRAQLKRNLIKRLRLRPSEKHLLNAKLKNGFFVILSRHRPDDEDEDDVEDSEIGAPIGASVITALRDAYPSVTFLALAGHELQDMENGAPVKVIDPRLEAGVEDAAIAAALELDYMTGSD